MLLLLYIAIDFPPGGSIWTLFEPNR